MSKDSVSTVTADLQAPAGITIQNLIGAAHIGTFVYVFAQGSDNALWCRFWLNNAWQPWLSLGAPAGGLAVNSGNGNNVVTAGNSIWVFAPGKDGKIWCNLWNGQTWTWIAAPATPPGTTITSMLGATMIPSLYVYGMGADKAIWGAKWSGAVWIWGKTVNPNIPSTPALAWNHSTALSGSWMTAVTVLTLGIATYGYAEANSNAHYESILISFYIDAGHVKCTVIGSAIGI